MRERLLLVATAALLAACGTTDGPRSDAATGGTLIIALPADPTDVFPPYVSETTGRLVQDQVFDRLAEISDDLTTIGDKGFTPRLAKSWVWAPDSMSIAFSIDPQARWHDGKPVTAKDVQYSLRAFTDPKVGSPVAPLLTNLDSVSIRDSLTPVVWFKRHTPEQFYDVAYQLIIMPEHVYGAIPLDQLRTSPITRTPIGSGQFRFVKWEPSIRLEMVADTANYRGRAKLDRIIITKVEPTVAESQVLAGTADFMDAFPIDHVPQLEASAVARPLVFPNFGYVFMGMNQYDPKSKNSAHPIFADKRVRHAFAIGVDRQAMLQNVFGQSGRLSHGPFPMTAGYADSTLNAGTYDTVAAKAMLDSSGWRAGPDGVRAKNGRPLRFTLVVPATSLFRKKYGVLLQEQFRKIGAQVDVDVVEGNMFVEHSQKGTFDAIMGAFNTDPGPSGMKQPWSSSGIVAGQNLLRYSSRKFDALIDSATLSFDATKAKQYASRASQVIIDDVPAIFLYDITLVYALNRRVIPTTLRTDEWWAHLADWTIPADKRIDRDRIGLTPGKP